jgi:NTP pyrophosphatase (non-canonical NTP hydrolase)
LFTGKLLKKELLNESIWQKDSFEDEIADVFIRLGDMCEALGVDIEWQIKKKMEYNKNRPYKHGKQF